MAGPTPVTSVAAPQRSGDRDLRRAWIAVALLPVAFAVAMLVGEGLFALLGYGSSVDEAVPVRVALLAGIPAVLLLVAPGVAAVFFGRRAHRAGRRAAQVPAWIGGAIAVIAVTINVLAYLIG